MWERFGHNALWIHDGPGGTDRVYNWGIFDFGQEDFFPRLLTGHMRYRLAAFSLRGTLRQYRLTDRSVYLQELRLTGRQRRRLQRNVRVNYLPENRQYAYDPYLDNCSTRVRDHLNRVLDGRLRAATESIRTERTWRSHTLRLLRRDPLPYLGLAVGMGEPADATLTAWQEMFLPLRMRSRVRAVRVDGEGTEGRSLVAREDTLYLASRPPAPARPPDPTAWLLAASVLLGGLFVGLGELAGRGSGPARHAFGGLGVLWCVIVGVAGTMMAAGWAFTDHWFLYRNENLLQANTLFLVLAPLLGRVVWSAPSPRTRRWARRLAVGLAGLGVLGFGLQVVPGLDQVNGMAVALLLPANLGLAVALLALRDRPGGPAAG